MIISFVSLIFNAFTLFCTLIDHHNVWQYSYLSPSQSPYYLAHTEVALELRRPPWHGEESMKDNSNIREDAASYPEPPIHFKNFSIAAEKTLNVAYFFIRPDVIYF